jgi:hypothetical protein
MNGFSARAQTFSSEMIAASPENGAKRKSGEPFQFDRGEPGVGGNDLLAMGGAELLIDPAGALFWPEYGLLVVADLHLEKGSAYAARRVFLPPYDTAATLARLAVLVAIYRPCTVLALGDSFHDAWADARIRRS